MNPILNFFAFQAGWFACVLGAANGRPWVGVLVTLLVVGLHLRCAKRPVPELKLMAAALVMGLLLDSILVANGWLTYSAGMIGAGLAPYWILALWVLFASTLNVSMRWLRGRPVLALAMGALGGPLSYLAGARLGAVQFAQGPAPFVALAVGWAVAMPALAWLAEQLDGVRAVRHESFLNGAGAG